MFVFENNQPTKFEEIGKLGFKTESTCSETADDPCPYPKAKFSPCKFVPETDFACNVDGIEKLSWLLFIVLW